MECRKLRYSRTATPNARQGVCNIQPGGSVAICCKKMQWGTRPLHKAGLFVPSTTSRTWDRPSSVSSCASCLPTPLSSSRQFKETLNLCDRPTGLQRPLFQKGQVGLVLAPAQLEDGLERWQRRLYPWNDVCCWIAQCSIPLCRHCKRSGRVDFSKNWPQPVILPRQHSRRWLHSSQEGICFFFLSEPVAFRRVYGLESYSRTSGGSNYHRQSVSDVKNAAIPTEPRGRLSQEGICN